MRSGTNPRRRAGRSDCQMAREGRLRRQAQYEEDLARQQRADSDRRQLLRQAHAGESYGLSSAPESAPTAFDAAVARVRREQNVSAEAAMRIVGRDAALAQRFIESVPGRVDLRRDDAMTFEARALDSERTGQELTADDVPTGDSPLVALAKEIQREQWASFGRRIGLTASMKLARRRAAERASR